MPTLNGMPTAEPQVNFCVEKPLIPPCARMVGSDAGKAETVRQHKVLALLPKLALKKMVPVEQVTRERFQRRGIHVAFIDR